MVPSNSERLLLRHPVMFLFYILTVWQQDAAANGYIKVNQPLAALDGTANHPTLSHHIIFI